MSAVVIVFYFLIVVAITTFIISIIGLICDRDNIDWQFGQTYERPDVPQQPQACSTNEHRTEVQSRK